MKALTKITAVVAPLDRANIDTDAIIPKQFLKSIKRTGFGAYLFDEWRYLDPGTLDKKPEDRTPNPDFVLNQAPYNQAQILITQQNFGCGSSREHAPWALMDFGIRVVIAPSFADIFFNNCFKNGFLPIQMPQAQIDYLFEYCAQHKGCEWTVDLENCLIQLDENEGVEFTVEPARRETLLHGLDDIALVLKHRETIEAFENKRRSEKPWLFNTVDI